MKFKIKASQNDKKDSSDLKNSADILPVRRRIEIILKIFFAIPTFMVLLEIFIFGWQPKVGFFSQFYNPRLQCVATKSQEKIEGSHYTYEIDLIVHQPIIEVLPFSPHKTHNINLYTYPDTFVDRVDIPDEISTSAVKFSFGEKENLRRGMDFSYRFVDVERIKFHVKVATNLNLGKKECALNVSFY